MHLYNILTRCFGEWSGEGCADDALAILSVAYWYLASLMSSSKTSLLCLYRLVLHFLVCYSSIIHLAYNIIAPYCCVIFLRRGLRDKIIHGTARHTYLCSCRPWVA